VCVCVRACLSGRDGGEMGERWGREREEWWLFVADVFL
jgi:hypothetical protein